jgi:aspartate carbamoyltransferase catalytic subunit
MKHILTVDQFTKDDLADLVQKAVYHRTASSDHPYPKPLVDTEKWLYNHFNPGWYPRHTIGKILTNLFYEPSSRTFASFHAAMLRLGGQVIPIQDAEIFSSSAKGESLEDTIKTMQCYSDVIVLRHKQNGAAERAAKVAEVPIINAGDGTNEHPTQALLDFFTILMERGWTPNYPFEAFLTGLKITMLGDLKRGRTVKSLSKLLRKYDVAINWVSPEVFRIPSEFVDYHDNVTTDLDTVIAYTDVLYVVRTQYERPDPSMPPLSYDDRMALALAYSVTPDHMRKAKDDMVLLHPMPRLVELPTELDADPRSAYFRQMRYGLFMRMAVLETVLI